MNAFGALRPDHLKCLIFCFETPLWSEHILRQVKTVPGPGLKIVWDLLSRVVGAFVVCAIISAADSIVKSITTDIRCAQVLS